MTTLGKPIIFGTAYAYCYCGGIESEITLRTTGVAGEAGQVQTDPDHGTGEATLEVFRDTQGIFVHCLTCHERVEFPVDRIVWKTRIPAGAAEMPLIEWVD